MRQVAQVTEHTGILDRALLTSAIALVLALRADKGEDALENRRGELGEGGGRGARRPELGVVAL